MATILVQSYTKFSLLKQLMVETKMRCQVTNNILQTAGMTYFHCRYLHVTPTYFKQRKAEKVVPDPNSMNMFPNMNRKKKLPMIDAWMNITVAQLAASANRSVDDVLVALSFVNSSARYTKDSILTDMDILKMVVNTLGFKLHIIPNPYEVKKDKEKDCDVVRRPPPSESELVKRHPVVTVMGHVDHGKTTLLDALRKTSVVQTEFGGITQHIGAFNVTLESGECVTFFDTPGHAAFSAMRARGANVTDIVVLVVAADDGVMEQTVQSIEMANDAKVPMIVAINKIDKPGADIARTQNMLSQKGILVEDLGGDVQCVNVSALKGTNLNTLTQAIVLQAELMNLRGDPNGLVEGVVIECSNDPRRGKLATVLIQRGTLRKGAVLVCGLAWAKVRSMFDHAGNLIQEARLSEAVQVIGWRSLPNAGDELLEVENERKAKAVIATRESKKEKLLATEHQKEIDKKREEHLKVYKPQLMEKILAGKKKVRNKKYITPTTSRDSDNSLRVNVIIKGDVAGSVEAILDVLDTYEGEQKCQLGIVHYGVGATTESDLDLAETFDAIIYQFYLKTPSKIKELAEEKKITIRDFNVIYKLIDDLKEEINSKLPMVTVEDIIGEAKVLQEFEITEKSKKVKIAGCRCTKGMLKKSALYHLVRGEETIYTGKLLSMKHLKDEVSTINVDTECGLRLENPSVSFEPGDTLICFRAIKKVDKIDWDPGF